MNDDLKLNQLLEEALDAPGDGRPGGADVCRREEDLAAYLDGSLPEPERAGLEQHLAQCEACRLGLGLALAAESLDVDTPVPAEWLREAEALFEPAPSAGAPARSVSAPRAAESWRQRLADWFTWPRLASAGALAITAAATIVVLSSLPAGKEETATRTVAIQAVREPEVSPLPTAPARKPAAPPSLGAPSPGFETRGEMDVAEKGAGLAYAPGPQEAARSRSMAASAERNARQGSRKMEEQAGLRLTSLTMVGDYDKALFQQKVQNLMPRIASCYREGLRHQSEAAPAILVELVIDGSGRLGMAADRKATLLERCVIEQMAGGLLPKPVGGKPVLVSMDFRAR